VAEAAELVDENVAVGREMSAIEMFEREPPGREA
jgi:hypothetical protein